MNNYAIDTAARFGDIPFTDFSRDLLKGVFDGLVEAHILQVEEYATFINSLTEDLSTYINNTVDDVSFDQITEFIENYELPALNEEALTQALNNLESPEAPDARPEVEKPQIQSQPSIPTWYGALIGKLAPAATKLVDKIRDPDQQQYFEALVNYNNTVLEGAEIVAENLPTYKQIHDAIAALIVSNKYGILQTLAQQGMMRLVVTEGEIETKLTFSTWNSFMDGSSNNSKTRDRVRTKSKNTNSGGLLGIFKLNRSKDKEKKRTITVNTAKSYQRDSSGTKVDIFGRVLIRFKSDYSPLNG